MYEVIMMKVTVGIESYLGSKSYLCLSPKTTHIKYGSLFQKRSVYAQFWLFVSWNTYVLLLVGVSKNQQQPRYLSYRHNVQTFETHTLCPPLHFPYGLFGKGV
jgi:hypothetical protein